MAVVTNILAALLLADICLAVTYVAGAPLAEADPVEPDYRLTGVVTPSHYEIELKPHATDDGDFDYFEGSVLINVEISEEINKFHIHVGELMIIDVVQLRREKNEDDDDDDDGIEKATAKKDFSPENDGYEDNELYYIELEDGSKITNKIKQIYIEFKSMFPTGMYGFYKSYYTEDAKERILLTTQFQPTHARKAFPCFDEPSFKATFKLTIKVPDGYKAISNTEQDTTTGNEIKFKETPIMSTYLLAFIVYDEVSYSYVGDDEKHFNTWGRTSEIEKGAGKLSQMYGPDILKAMEDYTDIDYYLNDIAVSSPKPTKVDQAAIPDFSAGAMENWGLVTYRETALLYDEKRHSQVAKKRIIEVIAHELAHQWFGNLVTTSWWSSTWLNEGFATFFEYYLTQQVTKNTEDWRMDERFVVDEQLRALGVDAVTSAPALTNIDVTYPSEVSEHFGTITYSKGGSILRMFENILKDKFKQNLQEYLKKYALQPVTPDNLFDELIKDYEEEGKVTKDNLKSILNNWTTKNGFPLISALKNGKNIDITQKRFLLNNEDDDTKYDIRINLKTHANDEVKVLWLLQSDENESVEKTNEGWFLIAPTGYFRVTYDNENWRALINELEKKTDSDITITELERAVLIDDSLNLARAGKLDYSIAIDLLSYLENEDDFIPWSAASIGLNFLHRMLVQSENNDNIIEKFILRIVKNVYTNLEGGQGTDHITKVHHANIFNWACKVGHEECLRKAEEEFESHLNDKNEANVDIRNTVYCYGVKNNGTAWIQLWNKLINEDDAVERSVIISGLGCSSNELVLYMYLESAVANNIIRPQDIASVFSSVYSNPDGINTVLTFLEGRMKAVADTTETVMNGMTNILNGISSYLTTEEQKIRLEKLKENDIKDSIKVAIDKAIITVDTNLKWLNDYESDVLAAMQSDASTTVSSTTTDPSTTPDGASQIFPTILVLITAFISIVCL